MINFNLKEYEVISQVHSGKRSIIYKAKRILDDQPVIIKVKNKEYPTNEDIKCLQLEFELGNRINSSAVIKYIEIKNFDKRIAIVQEYFEGESLETLIKSRLFTIEEFLRAAIGICEGLETIHAANIIHKHINASNILYNRTDNQVKIIDFGSAMYSYENAAHKNQNISESSLYYLSPEQTGRINRAMDHRSDLYSLGIVFYFILTGHLPFESKDLSELVYCHIAKNPQSVYEVNSLIPKIISDIIMKLMDKNPEERYQSAFDLKIDLKRCITNIEDIINFSFKPGEFCSTLSISQKLYGRENQIKLLLQSFERVAAGGTELYIITGAPGIGKSALIQEINQPVIQKQGHFIVGKFEQFQNDIPYSAIIQALENLIDQLIVEPPAQLKIWRQRILEALGNNGQVIVDVLPSLKLIIGDQPLVSQLGATETQNRFNLVFENFMQTIAGYEHPLVMFIDDWQWADTASLNFIKMLMNNKQHKYLLVIGAYRDNKADLIRPVRTMIDELVKNQTITNTIYLKALQKQDVQAILEDTLASSPEALNAFEDLSGFIYDKTLGNPFFVKQFLKSLYDKGYIWFESELLHWRWAIEKIKQLNITENVVDLLVSRIETLNPMTIQELKYGACIGNQFDLHTMALINEKSLESVQAKLLPAVKEGFISVDKNDNIQPVGNAKFRFVHDRVQQAVYSMLAADTKYATHLQLGRAFLTKSANDIKPEQLFELVRQFNAGRTMIIDKTEQRKLAELNLRAGKTAKSASAYNAAFLYFQTGIELLDGNSWQEEYELTLQLYSEITEAAYLISDYREMDKFADIVLENAHTVIDKIKVYKVKIEALQAQLNLQDALNTGISVLKSMEIDIPNEPTQSDVEAAFESTWKVITGIKVEELVNLPPMKDPVKLGAMQILLSSVSATYKAAPLLTPIVVCKMVELSIKYGNASFSPVVYSFYGLTLCSFIANIELGDQLEKYIELGYKLGKINVNLVENQNMKPYKAMVLEVDSYCVKHWKEHVKATLKPLMEGYWAGVENGNFEYGGYCLPAHTKNSIYIGQPLEEMEKEIEISIKRLQKIQQGLCINWELIFGQLVQNLQGKAKHPARLTGDFCDEDKMFPIVRDIGDMVGMTFLFLSKMMLNYHFQNYAAAIEFGGKVEENLGGVAGMIDIAVFTFFDSLARLAIYPTISKNEQEHTLAKVTKNQAKMYTWSKFAPMNFLHKFYLVEAEISRVTARIDEARKYYEKSIDLAKENDYLNDTALAYELAGKFYLGEGRAETAKIYLREARHRYQLWGAVAKVKDLEDKYPNICVENRTLQETPKSMDLLAIVKASQAISGEINLEALLSRLMTVMLENMGAQKGFLVLKRADELLIEAYVDAACEHKEVLTSLPLNECEDIPKTVIRFTARTGESIVFPGKSDKSFLDKDNYIIAKKPKSFFSTAIVLKNEVRGVLYLENNLAEDVFSPDRVQVIELLAAQAAISLENALLYNTLEQKEASLAALLVRLKKDMDSFAEAMYEGRAYEFNSEIEELAPILKCISEQTERMTRLDRLNIIGEMAAGIAHEVRNPMTTVRGLLQLLGNKQEFAKYKEKFELMIEEIDRANSIITEFLSLAKNKVMDFNENNLNDIILEIYPLIQADALRNNCEIALSLGDVPDMPLDQDGIRQLILNMVRNGMDAMPGGGRINISTRTSGPKVLLAVKDHGVGILPEYRGKLGTPFFTTKENGTGLGLAVCYRIAQRHAATITVESEPGKGAVFTVGFNQV